MARRAKAVKSVRPSNGNGASALATAPDSQVPQVDRQQLFQEISSNTWRFGFHQERLLNPDELVGRKGMRIYRQMLADDQVKAALALKKHAILSTGWDVEPASDSSQDVEVAEFCSHVFTKMDGSLDDNLMSVLSALQFGFSVTECCYRPLTTGQFVGKIGLRALKTRKPDEFAFITDSHDNLLENGIEQFGKKMPSWKFAVFCIHGDTKIHTPNGDIPIRDLVGQQPWVFGWKDGKLRLGKAKRVWQSGKNAPCVKVSYRWRTRRGWKTDSIICTAEHRFMQLDGTFCKAGALRPGNRLQPFNQTQDKKNGRWSVQAVNAPWPHGMVSRARWIWEQANGKSLPKGYEVHHCDESHDCDLPENLVALSDREHNKISSRAYWRKASMSERQKRGRLLAKGHKKFWKDPIRSAAERQRRSEQMKKHWSKLSDRGIYNRRRAAAGGYEWMRKFKREWWKTADKKILSAAISKGWSPERRASWSAAKAAWWQAKKEEGHIQPKDEKGRFAKVQNHEVVSVEPWGFADVYDMEVPDLHCFAANGVIIHNSAGKEFDNHYGTSDLRAAYRPWWLKDFVLKAWGIFLDRYSVPLALGTYPAGSPMVDGQVSAFRSALEGLQLATTMTMPADFKVDFPEVGAQGSSVFDLAISRQDAAIARAILVPNLLGVSPQGDVGSYSQARKQFDVFILVVEKLQRDLAETVLGEQILRRLVDLNYRVEEYPTFTFLPFTETDKTQLMSLFFQAIAAGGVTPRPQDEAHIRTVMEFPEVPLEELQAAAEAAKAQQPGMIPDQGETLPSQGEPSEEPEGEGEPELSDEELDSLIDEILGTEKASA